MIAMVARMQIGNLSRTHQHTGECGRVFRAQYLKPHYQRGAMPARGAGGSDRALSGHRRRHQGLVRGRLRHTAARRIAEQALGRDGANTSCNRAIVSMVPKDGSQTNQKWRLIMGNRDRQRKEPKKPKQPPKPRPAVGA